MYWIRLFTLFILIGNITKWVLIEDMIKNSSPVNYEVVDYICGIGRVGASVAIHTSKGKKWLTYPLDSECHKLEVGQYVQYYYNEKFHFYYFPHSERHKRFTIFVFSFFCLTFILPLFKIK